MKSHQYTNKIWSFWLQHTLTWIFRVRIIFFSLSCNHINMQACLEAWQILLKMRNMEKEQKASNTAGTIESPSAQNFWHPQFDRAEQRLAWEIFLGGSKAAVYSVQKVSYSGLGHWQLTVDNVCRGHCPHSSSPVVINKLSIISAFCSRFSISFIVLYCELHSKL